MNLPDPHTSYVALLATTLMLLAGLGKHRLELRPPRGTSSSLLARLGRQWLSRRRG